MIRAFRESRNINNVNQSGIYNENPQGDYKSVKTIFDLMNETAQAFFSDLYKAMNKDMNMIGRKTDRDNP